MYNGLEYIIVVLIGVFQILFITFIISPIKFNRKEFIGLMFVSSILSLISASISKYLLDLTVVLIIGLYIFFNKKHLITISINAVIPISVIIISNYILANMFSLLDVNIYEFNNRTFFNYLISYSINLVISLIISIPIGYVLNNRFKILELCISRKQTIIMVTFFIISFIILYFSLIFKKDFYVDNVIMTASFIIQVFHFGITTFILFYFISEIKREDEIRRERELSEQMASYTNELERMYVIAHGFKHDYRNILFTLSGYIDGNDIDGMKEYFYKELSKSGDIIPASGTVIKNLTNLKITPIKSLVSSKSATAQKFNIDFAVEVVEPIDYIKMPTLDLVRIVGIVLDNAIEASMKCDNPYVRFGIMKGIDTENSEVITILTTNNFTGEVPQLNRLYERGYSTKGDGRGIGLNNLKSIVDQYEYASIDIKIDDEKFCSKITILNSRSDSNA